MHKTLDSFSAVTGNYKKRIKTLDSLRGLAALSVVLGHALSSIFPKGNFLLDFTPLYIICSSHEAVIFFFLLSGYVLVYQYVNGKEFNYSQFIVVRITRIYIPYFMAIILSLLLWRSFKDSTNIHFDNFLKSQWHFNLTFDLLLNHVFLIGNFKTDTINTVIWSLVHEMRVSLIFPLLIALIKLKWRIVVLTSLVISVLACIAIVQHVNPSLGFNNSYLYTLHYFSFFMLGGLLAKHQTALLSYYSLIPENIKKTLLIIAILTYATSHLTVNFLHYFKLKNLNYSFLIADWLTVSSSFYLMIAAIAVTNHRTWLKARPLITLGKISYSLYLVHIPALYVSYKLMPLIPFSVVMMIGTLASICIAIIFNKWVETPAADFGKYVLSYFKQPKVV
jgi:peptidoglycan/LPS O-acetylase OafA/YrhL